MDYWGLISLKYPIMYGLDSVSVMNGGVDGPGGERKTKRFIDFIGSRGIPELCLENNCIFTFRSLSH